MKPPRIEIRTAPAPRTDLPDVRPVDLCDTCCAAPVTAAYALSDRIIMVAKLEEGPDAGMELPVHDHEARWLACRLCELLIDSRNVDGLVERAKAAAPAFGVGDLPDRLNSTAMRLVTSKTKIELR